MKSKILSERSAMVQRALTSLEVYGFNLQSKLKFHLNENYSRAKTKFVLVPVSKTSDSPSKETTVP